MQTIWGQAAVASTYLERYVLEGGIMMWALVPTAMLGLGYALLGLLALRRGRIAPRRELQELTELAAAGDVGVVVREAATKRSLAARIIARALIDEELPLREAATTAIREEVARLFRAIHPLAVIFNIAPYMGILGTVLGLLGTFDVYAANPNPSIADLGTGLTTALLTTIWGLAIAVPSYLFYQLFRGRLIRYEEDLLPMAVAQVMGALRASTSGNAGAAGAPEWDAKRTRLSAAGASDSGTLSVEASLADTPEPTASDGAIGAGQRARRAERPTEQIGKSERPTSVPLAEEDGHSVHPENPTEEIRLP